MKHSCLQLNPNTTRIFVTTMSFSTAQMSLSSKLVSPVAHRPAVRHNVRSRGALQVQNATLWSLQHKGKEIEITSEVGKKDICTVGGKSATEQDKVCAVAQSPSHADCSVTSRHWLLRSVLTSWSIYTVLSNVLRGSGVQRGHRTEHSVYCIGRIRPYRLPFRP